mmetsp:Transcript_14625/g.34741  ORF Transcript_14625/g.34741 Transcript_14625/m.34741 type:complete len:150 (+) Transcript_14625:781-1230(+)
MWEQLRGQCTRAVFLDETGVQRKRMGGNEERGGGWLEGENGQQKIGKGGRECHKEAEGKRGTKRGALELQLGVPVGGAVSRPARVSGWDGSPDGGSRAASIRVSAAVTNVMACGTASCPGTAASCRRTVPWSARTDSHMRWMADSLLPS